MCVFADANLVGTVLVQRMQVILHKDKFFAETEPLVKPDEKYLRKSKAEITARGPLETLYFSARGFWTLLYCLTYKGWEDKEI